MIYSAGCEYAIRALSRLAQRAPNGAFCLLRDIVEKDELPEHFVGKLLQQLVRADLLISAKGRGGGFALRGLPGEITLRQIVEAIDGKDRVHRCILGLTECNEHQACPQHDLWAPIRRQIEDSMDKTTLADLAESLAKKQARSEKLVVRRK